jgi:hypothetical protein
MNDAQVLERLTSAYATLEPPAPTAALAELFESDEEERDAVVVPFVRPRTRVRMRHLVAALAATFVLFSGLAVAGALPDPVQRQVSSVVSHLGIDLPSPGSGAAGDPSHTTDAPDAPGAPDRPHTTSSPTTGASGSVDAPVGGTPAPGTTAPAGVDLGGVGAVTGGPTTPTTLPPSGGSLLPPLTVPEITVPTLPPVTVPQVPLPPLPPLPLPPLPPLPPFGL